MATIHEDVSYEPGILVTDQATDQKIFLGHPKGKNFLGHPPAARGRDLPDWYFTMVNLLKPSIWFV